jgi:hypothetical protein
MPRSFFNLRPDHLLVRDTRAEDCSGPGVAVEHGGVAALNLMCEKSGCKAGRAGRSISQMRHGIRLRRFRLPSSCNRRCTAMVLHHDSLDNRHGTADRLMAHAY